MVQRKKKNKIFISGYFNILHPGHLRLIRFAKNIGGKLVVGVISSKINNSHHDLIKDDLRISSLESISWIDEVILIKKSINDTISKIKPNYIVKGKEFENLHNEEELVAQKFGAKLIFSSGEVSFSSYDLLKNEIKIIDKNIANVSRLYLKNHNIKKQNLIKILNKISRLRIFVVGDLIIDEYIDCHPIGMSQEDPTIVVSPHFKRKFVGGSAIVSAHAAKLGANVRYCTIAGNDQYKKFADQNLQNLSIDKKIIIDQTRNTTLKKRYRSQDKTLLKVSYLNQDIVSEKISDKIFSYFKKQLNDLDMIVFSDFNYGCISNYLIKKILPLIDNKNLVSVADSQSSSQIGDISRFTNMTLFTPTEREARVSLNNNEDGLVVLAEKLRKKSNSKNIFLKLGKEGLLIHSYDEKKQTYFNDRIPSLNPVPVDVNGAGDSMMIIGSMALASGANIWEAALLGSLASSVQISRIGNNPINKNELLTIINKNIP